MHGAVPHIWDMVLPLDVEDGSQMAKLESCQSLDVSAIKSGALHGVEQARENCS